MLMRLPCCLSVCLYPPQQLLSTCMTTMKHGIIPSKAISMVYFINPTHQDHHQCSLSICQGNNLNIT
jgi:hypothetical protein